MTAGASWRAIVASALNWEQAHVRLDKAVESLPAELRGRRAPGVPYSIWELVEHIRRTQRDLLEFCRNANYEEPEWPEAYWPSAAAPDSDRAWTDSLAGIRKDREDFEHWTVEAKLDLTEKIPHGTGQTYLRTVIVAVDHTSYHVGQIVLIRKLLGAWA